MTKYVKKTNSSNEVQYRNLTTGQAEDKSKISPSMLEELELADEGTIIDSETLTNDSSTQVDTDGNAIETAQPEDDKPAAPQVVDAPDSAEPEEEEEADEPVVEEAPRIKVIKVKMDDGKKAPVSKNPYLQASPTSSRGFGFPIRNGKTVDIFDLKTPHTELRSVAGMNVPLSLESYKTKSEAEIYTRLVEIGLVDQDASGFGR